MAHGKIDLKKSRAEIALRYGIELDETSITILTILKQDLKSQFAKMDQAQEEISWHVQRSKRTLQVDTAHPRWQAFWHGMGQWGLGLSLGAIVVLVVFSIDWNRDRQEKEQLQQELAAYKAYYQEHEKAARSTGAGPLKRDAKQRKK